MASNLKDVLLKIAKTVLPLAFGILIFWLIFRKQDIGAIMAIVRSDVSWWIIIASLPFGLAANIVRGLRWKLLILPLGYTPRTSNMVYAVLGCYGVNLAFPRAGEVWRCAMINRYEKVPFTKAFGTLIIDRLADLVPVGLIVIAAFFMNIPYFRSFFDQHPQAFDIFSMIFSSPWTYIAIAALAVAVWIYFVLFKQHALVIRTKQLLLQVWEGILTIANMKQKWLFIFYTVLIWLGYFLYFYICFYAFPFTRELGWNCGLIAFGMSSVAVAVPVQGGIGTWHAMVIAVLMGFGVLSVDASAFTLTVHTIQQLIFTAAFGLFGIIALPLNNKKKRV